ncbi:Multidrug resistance efflux pump [Sphingomonas laterariae]|uniref:Multidrug resistance efflux pump n=1 Tax=Edaphosphingomonas laterariae TaxID=861865 RepID=A0A239HZ04_9SPHN|nr:Multidrug resistance efflux pump [Sphingomonas laterariae]
MPDAGFEEQSLVLAKRPFSSSITFAGAIVAGDAVAVFAPFDGKVKTIGFTYGDRVVPGQMLVELDLSDLQKSRNEAEGTLLKAAEAASQVENWNSGPEVARARRSAASAAYDLNDTERKIQETKALLDKGLVSRSEYDGLLQQRRSQQMAAQSAQDDLKSTLARGQGSNLRVARLELINARARYAELHAQWAGAVVRATAAGIIVRPPSGPSQTATDIRVGSSLNRGALIGSIARAGGLAASFRIDEGDVNQLKPGMPVTVTGAGFGGAALTGSIFSVAGEADSNAAATGGKAGFTAIARLDPLPAEQAQQVRIGMSANIAITVYTTPSALVVPAQAISGVAPESKVAVRNKDGTTSQVIVQIGRVSPEGVEVLSGVKAGDTVIWKSVAVPVAAP